MKRLALVGFAVLVCLGVVGCNLYNTPVMPPQGWIVSNIKAPLSADNGGVKVNEQQKMGMAEVENYLGIISVGNCSIEEAADEGNITTIDYADYEYFNVLGVYQRFTVKVHGN